MIIKINEAEWPFNVIYLGIKSYIINSTFENVAHLVRHSGVKLLDETKLWDISFLRGGIEPKIVTFTVARLSLRQDGLNKKWN